MTTRRMRYGMPFLLETESLAEALALCLELELGFIELNSNFPQCQLDRLQAEELRELTECHGISFTLHLDDHLNIADFNGLVREAYVQTVLDGIDLAKEAGISVLNLHLAKGNIVTLPDGKHYLFERFPEVYEGALRDFRDACTEAIGDAPVRIAMENTFGWEAYERRGLDLLLESPVFGLTLDIGHDDECGNQDLPYFLERADRLVHMHAHDGSGTRNHWALGAGSIPVQERLALAEEQAATVVLETKTIAALRESVGYLERHGLV